MLKKITRVGVVLTTIALIASGVGVANAGNVPAAKAKVGLDCSPTQVGKVSKGTGVNGSDLTCTEVTTGTFKYKASNTTRLKFSLIEGAINKS
jgi:putative tricarboxylic transport membrane protein